MGSRKTNYILLCHQQNASQNHEKKRAKNPFENAA
jgi:hypothetical protein